MKYFYKYFESIKCFHWYVIHHQGSKQTPTFLPLQLSFIYTHPISSALCPSPSLDRDCPCRYLGLIIRSLLDPSLPASWVLVLSVMTHFFTSSTFPSYFPVIIQRGSQISQRENPPSCHCCLMRTCLSHQCLFFIGSLQERASPSL